jgi:lipoprotein-anchoring transpeptidase ErfK/SrfK
MPGRWHQVAGGAVLAALVALPAVAVAEDPPPAPPPSPIAAPSPSTGATIARLVSAAPVRSKPGAGRVVAHVSASTDWAHEPMELMVLGSSVVNGTQWLEVRLPRRPNRSSAWISADRVQLTHTSYWIRVRTRHRLVAVYRDGKLVHSYHAVIGKNSTPTPHGLFSIYERIPLGGSTFLGKMALPLTAFSPTLMRFGGGPGRVAIHGRGGASFNDPLGSARSHGCIRIDNRPITWIGNHVPRGTPVDITN